jgi:hypothetical protein
MASCLWCDGKLPKTDKPVRYCSPRCRQAAYRARKKRQEHKPTKKRFSNQRTTGDKITVAVSENVDAQISRTDFERMMDDSYEDLLRFSRDVLKKALTATDTPATAMAPIVKQLLNVGKELSDVGDDDLLSDDDAAEEMIADEFRPEAI